MRFREKPRVTAGSCGRQRVGVQTAAPVGGWKHQRQSTIGGVNLATALDPKTLTFWTEVEAEEPTALLRNRIRGADFCFCKGPVPVLYFPSFYTMGFEVACENL